MKFDAYRIILICLIVAGLLAIAAGLSIVTQPNAQQLAESKLVGMWDRQPPAPHSLPPRWIGKVDLLGYEAAGLGIVLVFLSLLLLTRPDGCMQWVENRRNLVLSAFILMTLVWLPVALWGHSAVLFGKRIWFLGDDPMISMRYAKNLAHGHGWVWNPGERVEGYTNPLWTLIMAGCHLLFFSDIHVSLIVLLINIVLSLWILYLLYQLVDIFGGNGWVKTGVLLAVVLNRNLLTMSMAGFEIPLLIALMLWALLRILKESASEKPNTFTYILLGILALVRSDAIVIAGLLAAYAFFLNPSKKAMLTRVAIMLLIPILHFIFRKWYYGEWLPNTAFLKVGQYDSRWMSGLRYAFGFIKAYFVYIGAALFGLCFTRKKIMLYLSGLIFLYSGYVIYTGGDAFHHFRFFLPILPLIMIMAFIGIQKLHVEKKIQALISLCCLAAMPLVFPGYTLLTLLPRPADIHNVELGLWIKANTSPDTRVADAWAGNTFYFSNRTGIDLLGKNDPAIAKMPIQDVTAKVGHNKFDYDYSLGMLKPDYVVGNFKLPVAEEDMKPYMTGDWAAAGALYFHPLFQEHCLPYSILADTWRSIFVCDWSEQFEKRQEPWHAPEI